MKPGDPCDGSRAVTISISGSKHIDAVGEQAKTFLLGAGIHIQIAYYSNSEVYHRGRVCRSKRLQTGEKRETTRSSVVGQFSSDVRRRRPYLPLFPVRSPELIRGAAVRRNALHILLGSIRRFPLFF